jgi:hypothetical protein
MALTIKYRHQLNQYHLRDSASASDLTHGAVLDYFLFCTAATPSGKMPDLSCVPPVKFDSMGQAINAACKLIGRGEIVWQIKGSEGFMMEHDDIEAECRQRMGR